MTNNSASTIAKYILSLGDIDAGDVISNLKLQKLLYYAQGFNLAVNKSPLFDDEIRAWTHGPVVPNVYREYKDIGSSAIMLAPDFTPPELNADAMSLVNEVYNVYGQYSAWKLRDMTHEEPPWVNAYGIAPRTLITLEAMESYFKTLVN